MPARPSPSSCRSTISPRRAAADLRISDPDPALDGRHGHADLGRRPDRALSRARADEPRALRGRRLEPRFRAVDRSRPEVFRARRAVVRHAALRLLADLRLHRQRVVRRHRQGVGAGRHRADLRPGVPVRGLLLQGLRGAVPHVDAGRLRGRADAGDGVLRRRARRSPRWRSSPAPPSPRSPASPCNGSRSWCSSRSPRWRSAPSPPSARPTSSG